jgi:hypothetical protein
MAFHNRSVSIQFGGLAAEYFSWEIVNPMLDLPDLFNFL